MSNSTNQTKPKRFPDPRPQLVDAQVRVTAVNLRTRSGVFFQHPDPADICRVSNKVHRTFATAARCEHDSQLINWKRAKALYADFEGSLLGAAVKRAKPQ